MRNPAASALRSNFEWLLSEEVRPLLRSRGFTKYAKTFRRQRGELYDAINFQGKWHSPMPSSFGFSVNVGVGSSAVDASWQQPWRGPAPRHPVGYLLDRRWEELVPTLPDESKFDLFTDQAVFAEQLREGLGEVLAVIEAVDSTEALVEYAVTNNLLAAYERTCCHLATVGDLDTLASYVATLRNRFGQQGRWAIFNAEILRVTGAYARVLVDCGLLDPLSDYWDAALDDRDVG
jgi:hypothetical protein